MKRQYNKKKSNSTERFKSIFRHKTELKWINSLQTPFPLGLNDNIYHEGNISKMPDFEVFPLLAHLSRRLTCELIVYQSSRRLCVFVHTFKHEHL